MKMIDRDSLVPLNAFADSYPILIDQVYARADHPDNHFPDLYHPAAQVVWADRNMAVVTLVAAKICRDLYGWRLKLNDCLRTVEAQEGMVKYGHHPSLISAPGKGAHPRAMAIDMEPLDAQGAKVPMGTSFDHLVPDPEREENPAARNYTEFAGTVAARNEIWLNRHKLEFAMRQAATACGQVIVPLPEEWWDFRFPREMFESYAPLREADLHPYQRLVSPDGAAVKRILQRDYPDAVAQAVATTAEAARKVVSSL